MEYPFKMDSKDSYHVLADTKKLIAQIRKDDPEMLGHARRKYEGTQAEHWLENNNEKTPHQIGVFAFHDGVNWQGRMTLWQKIKSCLCKLMPGKNIFYSNGPALTMSLGWAGALILIQDLDLPYVPIAVHSSYEEDRENKELLEKLIGAEQTR